MVVHPTYRNWSGTLLNGLLWHVRGRPGVQPSIITRLDKDTSGVVLVALTPEVHARVQRDSIAGRVRKQYLAVVRGTPAPARGSITLPLGRSLEDRRRVVVTSAGQHCHTAYEVLSSANGQSVVQCELLTGRTHQIRVHLAALGYPIVGDRVYGEADATVPRQALHAWRLSLPRSRHAGNTGVRSAGPAGPPRSHHRAIVVTAELASWLSIVRQSLNGCGILAACRLQQLNDL